MATEQTLEQACRKAVKKYLENLKGHQAKNLHDFIINQIEKGIIKEVLHFTKGNQTEASKILGLTRTTLRTKKKKHKIT